MICCPSRGDWFLAWCVERGVFVPQLLRVRSLARLLSVASRSGVEPSSSPSSMAQWIQRELGSGMEGCCEPSLFLVCAFHLFIGATLNRMTGVDPVEKRSFLQQLSQLLSGFPKEAQLAGRTGFFTVPSQAPVSDRADEADCVASLDELKLNAIRKIGDVSTAHAELLQRLMQRLAEVQDPQLKETIQKSLFCILRLSPASGTTSSSPIVAQCSPTPHPYVRRIAENQQPLVDHRTQIRTSGCARQWDLAVDPISTALLQKHRTKVEVRLRDDSLLLTNSRAVTSSSAHGDASDTSLLKCWGTATPSNAAATGRGKANPWRFTVDDLLEDAMEAARMRDAEKDGPTVGRTAPSSSSAKASQGTNSATTITNNMVLPSEVLLPQLSGSTRRAVFVIMHHAAAGEVDPYGVLCFNEVTISLEMSPTFIHGYQDDVGGERLNFSELSCVMSLIDAHCDVGTSVCRLRRFIAWCGHRSNAVVMGSYGNAAVACLRAQLEEYVQEVGMLLQRRYAPVDVSVPELFAGHRQLLQIEGTIDCLETIFRVGDPRKPYVGSTEVATHCTTAELLSMLYLKCRDANQAHGKTPTLQRITARLLRSAMVPLQRMLLNWLRAGLLDDPYDEFFVVPSHGNTASGYELRESAIHLPCFIPPHVAERILDCGLARMMLPDTVRHLRLRIQKEEDDMKLRDLEGRRLFFSESEVLLNYENFIIEAMPEYCVPSGDKDALGDWQQYYTRANDVLHAWIGTAGLDDTTTLAPSTVGAEPADSEDGRSVAAMTNQTQFTSRRGSSRDRRTVASSSVAGTSVVPDNPDERAIEHANRLQEAKKVAYEQIMLEHERHMKKLEHEEKMINWKGRRQKFDKIRNLALRSTVEDIQAYLSSATATSDVVSRRRELVQQQQNPRSHLPAEQATSHATLNRAPHAPAAASHEWESDSPPPPLYGGGWIEEGSSPQPAAEPDAAPPPLDVPLVTALHHSPAPLTPEKQTPTKPRMEEAQLEGPCQAIVKKTKKPCGRPRPCAYHDKTKKRFDRTGTSESATDRQPDFDRMESEDDGASSAAFQRSEDPSLNPSPIKAAEEPPTADAVEADVAYANDEAIWRIYTVADMQEDYVGRTMKGGAAMLNTLNPEDPIVSSPEGELDEFGIPIMTKVSKHWQLDDCVPEDVPQQLFAPFIADPKDDVESSLMVSRVGDSELEGSQRRKREELKANEAARDAALSQLDTFYGKWAPTACSFFTRQVMQLLLHRRHGEFRHVISSLLDVCLMQNGVVTDSLLYAWSEVNALSSQTHSRRYAQVSSGAAVTPASQRPKFEPLVALASMSRSFNKAWSELEGSKYLGLALTAPALFETSTEDADDGSSVASSSVGIPTNAFEMLPHINLDPFKVPTDSWLFPPEMIKRYSDMFVSLVFWRWVADLSKGIWQTAMRCQMREVWIFSTVTRSVLQPLVDHVWFGVSELTKRYKQVVLGSEPAIVRGWGDELLEDRDATLEPWPDCTGYTHLQRFTMDHDEFLSSCFVAAFLSPSYGHVRRTVRTMVRILEEVDRQMKYKIDQQWSKMQREFVRKRVADFASATDSLIKQLAAADSLSPTPAVTVLINALTAVVATVPETLQRLEAA